MVGLSGSNDRGIREYWPFLAGGILAPILANALTRWLALHYAVGVSNFVVWFVAIWLFQRTSGRSGMGMLGKLATSAVAGLAGGVLAFLFPWK